MFISDRSGPIRQRTINEWSIPGNELAIIIPPPPLSAARPAATHTETRRKNDFVLSEDLNRIIRDFEDDVEEMDGLGQGEGNEDDGGGPEDEMDDEEVSTS